jgi:hypothetical protein
LIKQIASSPNMPPAILAQLATNPSVYARREAADNPALPADALRRLADDKDEYVRRQVARHSATPREVLATLAKDKNIAVRGEVAANPHSEPAILQQLYGEERLWSEVAGNPATPAAVLGELAQSKDQALRWRLARNPSTPGTVLEALAADSDPSTRRWVAKNPSTPSQVLGVLSLDADKLVRLAVANNESFVVGESDARFRNWQFLMELDPSGFENHAGLLGVPEADRAEKRKELAQAFVAEHGRSNKASLKRLACLLLPDCPVPVLARAVRSTDWKERLAVASHPETPAAIRKQLAKDGNEFVRVAAQVALDV